MDVENAKEIKKTTKLTHRNDSHVNWRRNNTHTHKGEKYINKYDDMNC